MFYFTMAFIISGSFYCSNCWYSYAFKKGFVKNTPSPSFFFTEITSVCWFSYLKESHLNLFLSKEYHL